MVHRCGDLLCPVTRVVSGCVTGGGGGDTVVESPFGASVGPAPGLREVQVPGVRVSRARIKYWSDLRRGRLLPRILGYIKLI